MYRIAIIDDEIKIIKTIKNFISNKIKDIEIIGTATSAKEGIKIINSKKPNLILLDIEMPHINGFEMLELLPERNFDIIFITAYNEYAIEAFKVNAINYILKPFNQEELISAIEKAKENHKNSLKIENINKLINHINTPNKKKLKIATQKGIEFINPDNIIRIEADGNYSKIFLENNQHIYASKKIKELDSCLQNDIFFRSHKSHIINIEKVIRYNAAENTIIMSDNSTASLSRNKKEEFFNIMEKLI